MKISIVIRSVTFCDVSVNIVWTYVNTGTLLLHYCCVEANCVLLTLVEYHIYVLFDSGNTIVCDWWIEPATYITIQTIISRTDALEFLVTLKEIMNKCRRL